MRLAKHTIVVAALTATFVLCLSAQQPATTGEQSIPDAPSATRPSSPFPADTAPAPRNPERAQEASAPPAGAPAQPSSAVTTVPKGTAAAAAAADADRNSREDVIRVTVNQVVVPVTVKDSNGHLVDGLVKRDFAVLEDGVPQKISLFTSDPYPLSVAVVLDVNLPEQTMSKVRQTLPALVGAFSDYDEVSIFTYGNSVQKQLASTSSSQQLSITLKRSSSHGRTNGPPVIGGPMAGGPTPSVNGVPFDPSTPHVAVGSRESYVLNDAILAAAQELQRRERSRRKIVFVISDGHEDGSSASYHDVLKVLLSNEIAVYAIAVDASAIPGYEQLAGLHIPFFGYGNILGKYVKATGGETFAEFTQSSIEDAYAKVTEQARNQYTLAYNVHGTPASNYRSIEVRVRRPGLYVHAKDGYYPLPPQRANP